MTPIYPSSNTRPTPAHRDETYPGLTDCPWCQGHRDTLPLGMCKTHAEAHVAAEMIAALERQRDELAELVRKASDLMEMNGGARMQLAQDCRAALAKVKP